MGNKSSAQTTQHSTFQQSNTEKAREDTLKYPTTKGRVISDRLLEGVVTDTTGKIPVEGASIKVKGFKVGTATDRNGKFSLHTDKFPTSFTLEVFSLGYDKQEICIIKKHLSELNIKLKEAKMNIGDVIIVSSAVLKDRNKKNKNSK